MLYFAFGSNLHKKQMKRRCGDSKYIGCYTLKNYKLSFRTGNTKLMIFNFNFLISHITQFITLMPGDLITTGTPSGVGMGMTPPEYLKEGDQMKLKVDGLGEQNTKVSKEK